MNAGLRYLLRAGIRGFFRSLGRRMRTVRGFVATVFGGLFLAGMIALQAVALLLDRGDPAEHGTLVAGFSLLVIFFLVPALLAADAPFFWPQEVQFLFPAPVGRRELLLYQLLSRGRIQLFSALWIALVGMRTAPHPALAFPAVILALLFIFCVVEATGLLKVAAADRLPHPVVASVKPALALLAAAAGFAFYRRTQAIGFREAVGDLFASRGMQIATLPGRPFAEIYAAETAGAALAWIAAGAALVLLAGAAALSTGVDYRERSLVSSAKKFERLRRRRASHAGVAAAAAPSRRRIPVPTFAFLGLAAPLARRQAYELGRGLRVLASLAFTAVFVFFYVIVMPLFMNDGPEGDAPLGVALVVLVIVFPMMATSNLTLDFRRDLDKIGYLRSLPLPPRAVAAGQVFVAAALLAVTNLALLGVALAVADGNVDLRLAVMAAAGAMPAAWLAVALENWLFLLFPTRMPADGGERNAFLGKQVLKLIFRLLLLGVVAIAAGGVAMVGGWLAGHAGAAVGAALVVALACVGATALLARAFQGFDLTVDSPA